MDFISVGLRALGLPLLLEAAGIALFAATLGGESTGSLARARRLGRNAALAALVAIGAHYALEAARLSGELAGLFDGSLQKLAWASSARVAWMVKSVGLLLIAIGLGSMRPTAVVTAILGAVLATFGFTLTGHTSVGPHHTALAVLLETHLLIVAFWLGALTCLAYATSLDTPPRAAQLIGRFSRLATWLVPLILAAGLAMAALLIPSVAVLAQPYGELLLGKVAGFALLIGLAALNKWWLTPQIARGSALALARLRRSMTAESGLIVALIALTAVLTTFFSPS